MTKPAENNDVSEKSSLPLLSVIVGGQLIPNSLLVAKYFTEKGINGHNLPEAAGGLGCILLATGIVLLRKNISRRILRIIGRN